ncbi:metallophosphoesterase [Pedobacter sp. SYSU D00535]|uniref:metallophosphoesterase n=1 Tax=Pedobacter sp. SYSU D00535 TaxID=2810308 RepID=UPI001A971B7D|nr:metallophosphoesterase [Pedobacter sp. SYSU D00535]
MLNQPLQEPFELFLIGDTGDISPTRPDPVLETLKAHLQPSQESAVIFLGDNIYPRGMPAKGNILRKNAENTLKRHYEALKDYEGQVVFIAGNHDWNKGRKDGYEYILRQEKYIQQLFEGKNVFLPSNGCPGPVEVDINPHLTIVAIDTQWWLQTGLRPIGKQYRCSVSTEEEFFERLIAILDKNKHKHLLVAGHHPVYSYAIHGGRFKLKHHIFPLTIYDPYAYLPLPGLGSLLPLYRKFLGAREDMAHPRYRRLRKKLKEILSGYPNLIYAAGHEHNLQYIFKDRNHFIVSGSGSKVKYVVRDGKYLQFGEKAKGFVKLRFENDGSVFLSAWAMDTSRRLLKGKLLYEKQII